MGVIPGVAERALVRVVDKGRTIGRETKTAAKVVSREARQVIESVRGKPPLSALQEIAFFETTSRRFTRVEGDTAKLTGDDFNISVDEFMAGHRSFSRDQSEKIVRSQGVENHLLKRSGQDFRMIGRLMKTPPGSLTVEVEEPDPADPTKTIKVMKLSPLEELRDEITKQYPDIEKKRKINLAKIIAIIMLAITLDTGKQSSQEVRA